MSTFAPIIITSAQILNNNPTEGPGRGIGNGGVSNAPIIFGDDVFTVLANGDTSITAGFLSVFGSVDGGAVWGSLDAAHQPVCGQPDPDFTVSTGYWWFDGAKIIVCYPNAADFSIQFQDFDCATKLWGAPYGNDGETGPFCVDSVWDIVVRPDGSRVLITWDRHNGSGVFYSIWNEIDGWFLVSADLGAEYTALPGWDSATMYGAIYTTAMDADGNIHVFITISADFVFTPPFWDSRLFYMLLTTNNTVANFFDFPQQQTITPTPGVGPMGTGGKCCIAGDSILLPVTLPKDSGANSRLFSVVIGTPLSAPVFTTLTEPGIDPEEYPTIQDFTSGPAGLMFCDGETVYSVTHRFFNDVPFPNGHDTMRTQTALVSDLTSWTGAAAFENTNFFSVTPVSISFQRAQLMLTSTLFDFNAPLSPLATWMGNFTPAPPTPGIPGLVFIDSKSLSSISLPNPCNCVSRRK